MCVNAFTDQLHCSDDDGECCSRISGASPLQLLLSLSNANVHIAVVWGPAAAVVQSLLYGSSEFERSGERVCPATACLSGWLKSGQECDNERSEKVGTKKKDKTEKEQNTQQWKEKERESERGNETEETLLFSFCKLSCWAKLRRDNLGDISLHLVVAH